MATKRKALSKKIRFEIFKRDSFTCQYCGSKAPDVILWVDHIKPVANGGDNDPLNLVTSCEECNRGKGATELSDSSAVEKSRRQAEELQERREQLEMIIDWQKGLGDIQQQECDAAAEFFLDGIGTNYELWEDKLRELKRLISRFGFSEVMEAIRISKNAYLEMNLNGTCRWWTAEKAFDKIGGICWNKANKDKE